MPLRLPEPAFYLAALLAFLGFADAAYLTADHYFALPLPCSLTDGCDTVLTSQYSAIGPVPVALLGAVFYLVVLFSLVHLFTSANPRISMARGVWALSGLSVLASAYFVYLQVAVIKELCVYCLASATISALLFICISAILWSLSRQAKTAKPNVNF